VLLVAVGAGLTIALWLLPIGLLAYALMVGLTLRMPQPARAHVTRRAPTANGVFAPQLANMSRTCDEIQRSVAAADGPLRTTLERVTQQVASITDEAYVLADKGNTIAAYLRQVDRAGLQQQQQQIERQIANTSDAPLREQYGATQAALAEQMAHAEALELYLRRIQAQINTINANLDNVLAETVRLRAAPGLDVSPSADTVTARLADLRADMDALGQVLDSALTGVT
jgi:chromosome segregation ATPase